MELRRVGFARRFLSGLKRAVSIAHPTLFLAILLTGCATSGKVTMKGIEGPTIYAQSFKHAYISTGPAGEYDVVLMQDPQSKTETDKSAMAFFKNLMPLSQGTKNPPLQPMSGAELRQIIHIHVFWQADGGTVAKDGVVTNAAINWYMIAYEASDHPEILRYEGAGVVTLDEGRKITAVRIREGTMKQTEVQGNLKDPLGPSHLTGVVKAEQNAQLVRDILAELKARKNAGSVAMNSGR
jgi:hypothetical protein